MQTKDKSFLGTEPVGKLLVRLAVPTVIAQLVNMLYTSWTASTSATLPKLGALR